MVVKCFKIRFDLKPHQPGNDRNRAGSMAKWVAPIKVYIIYLGKTQFILYLLSMLSLFGKRWVAPNRWWYTFETLKRNEWSIMCGPGCKTFLFNPVYSPLEIHYRQVVPYLVMVGIQSPISACGFVYILYMWNMRCKRSARLLITCD